MWRVPGDAGRRYAAVSGDINPIHLHPATARLFGLPGAIAHGMWLKARCLAALEGSLAGSYAAEVRFKLPVRLPSRVGFAAERSDGGWEFGLDDWSRGRPHLAGRVEQLAGG
jgi:acyl dehydratase